MSNHTPGPWTIRVPTNPKDYEASLDVGISGVVYGEEKIIAEAFGQASHAGYPPAMANARLIASAPELLKVLRELVRIHLGGLSPLESSLPAWDAARAAIAQAEAGR